MAFDTLSVYAMCKELETEFCGAIINKVAQPEHDEINLTLKSGRKNHKLIISANASLPLIYIDNETKRENPLKAPNFCMVLRKYLQSGKINHIKQINFDRIVEISISHYDELGDLKNVRLMIEIMGKHSNIILIDENDVVIDSIKHINASISSKRLVFPGCKYFLINAQEKVDIFSSEAKNILSSSTQNIRQALLSNFIAISPLISEEICFRADIDSNLPTSVITENQIDKLIDVARNLFKKIQENNFKYTIYYSDEKPIDYGVIDMHIFSNANKKDFNNLSDLISTYYMEKNLYNRMQEKSTQIRQVLHNNIERVSKKLNIWENQLKDCNKKDKFKLYGELVLAYSYMIKQGDTELNCENYYDNSKIKIKLDEKLSPIENSNKYYEKYNKLKRTEMALSELVVASTEELNYLQSILDSTAYMQSNDDINDIKDELSLAGYMKKQTKKEKKKHKPKPLHYIDELGFNYFVGKNNLQNEEVTFNIASNNDWWFHTKNIAGSHVIVKNHTNEELPDSCFEIAASIAAYYSKAKTDDKVEVDYIQRKFIKKPATRTPGMVIYHTNYSMIVKPEIKDIKKIE